MRCRDICFFLHKESGQVPCFILGRLRRPRSLDAFLQKWSKTATNIGITNDLATTCCRCAILYGKTRVKSITERMPLCVNTVFSRIFHKIVHFYFVLQCKKRVSRNCKNILVLPCKSHFWAQKGPQNGSQNGPRITQNTCFTGVVSHCPS